MLRYPSRGFPQCGHVDYQGGVLCKDRPENATTTSEGYLEGRDGGGGGAGVRRQWYHSCVSICLRRLRIRFSVRPAQTCPGTFMHSCIFPIPSVISVLYRAPSLEVLPIQGHIAGSPPSPPPLLRYTPCPFVVRRVRNVLPSSTRVERCYTWYLYNVNYKLAQLLNEQPTGSTC